MRKWTIPLTVSLGGTILWWTHAVLTIAFPPFENALDTALWIVCSVLKLATIVCIPIVLGRVFVRCHRDLGATTRAMAVWGIGVALLLVVLSLVRAPLVRQLNNDAVRFFPSSMTSPRIAEGFAVAGVEWQVARWQSGETFLIELGFVVAAVLSLGILAFCIGERGFVSGLAATIWLALLFVVGGSRFRLLIGDYDFFLARTLVAPTAVDAIVPFVAADPTSEIGFIVYTLIIWSSWLLDKWLLRRPPPVAGP